MTLYVQDTSNWQDWQHDYRLGLILILPPPEVSDLIDPLRVKYDPRSFAICGTHISISDPLRHEMTPDFDDEIGELLGRIDPFMVHFAEPEASRDHARKP